MRAVATADRDRLVNDASDILTEMGLTAVQRDADAGRLVYTDAGDVPAGGAASHRLSSRFQRRRLVEVRIEGVPEGHKVYCRVAIQRQTTQAHGALAFGAAGDDRPGQTPIDRDAATTAEQNTVWETFRRDRPAERTILNAMTDRLRAGAADERG